jgi:hypothetical protein
MVPWFQGFKAETNPSQNFSAPSPKGASDFDELAVSLKRCPDTRQKPGADTKPEFFRSLLWSGIGLWAFSVIVRW